MVSPPESASQRGEGDGVASDGASRVAARAKAFGGYAAIAVVLLILWLLAPGSLFGESPSPGAPTDTGSAGGGASPGASSQVLSHGEALYTQSCASCHGAMGAGGQYGPNIQNSGQALTDFVLRTGRMPLPATGQPMRRGQPQFSDADREALVAYVASLGTGPTTPNVVTQGSDVAHGRDLYIANCAACHGPAGGGGAVGGGFVAPGLTVADETEIAEAVVSGPGAMPRFSFGPDDLRDLTGYVRGLEDAPHPGGVSSPVVGPVVEGFIAAISLVALLLVARWIAVRQPRQERERRGPHS